MEAAGEDAGSAARRLQHSEMLGPQQVQSGSQTEQATCVVTARAGEIGPPSALEPSRS